MNHNWFQSIVGRFKAAVTFRLYGAARAPALLDAQPRGQKFRRNAKRQRWRAANHAEPSANDPAAKKKNDNDASHPNSRLRHAIGAQRAE
jgi:hypothetical protein